MISIREKIAVASPPVAVCSLPSDPAIVTTREINAFFQR
jgi:hypothetical protein